MIKINKDVPMPDAKTGSTKYPFRDMEVGDSFALPKNKAATVRNSVFIWVKRNEATGLKFATRIVGDEIIVWRIK